MITTQEYRERLLRQAEQAERAAAAIAETYGPTELYRRLLQVAAELREDSGKWLLH
jgi:hypothetical protein